ncbi:MAG TPA: bifunctional phosphoribosyl-AMP cyclohydrolase/phosphoribosyl-ATP diphosphatase HisIE [Oscillospiraceae bacterium]|nr:bifunctional phosphoribosyl-AMP cyclohydrolase/phosphoribosyl-ATP diphosphatase HisIE [Oscillospiraceae bacterium]
MNINELVFDENGLIPTIVVDSKSKEVLTLAYMNRESLEISLKEKKTCFFSRKRQKLWRKGETSGNYQNIVSITSDCDNDALLIAVSKKGPACHTGENSCFFNNIYKSDENDNEFSLYSLANLINERKQNPKDGSYTNYLFEKGLDKILKKVGEESSEVIIAAKNNDKDEAIYEIADLTYHILVLMNQMNISVDEVLTELKSRHIIDTKIKQEKMT